MPIYRVGTSQCTINLLGSDRVLPLASTFHCRSTMSLQQTGNPIMVDSKRFTAIRGKSYYHNGRLDFHVPEHTNRDKFYTTVFGPACAHNGIILANSANNICSAIARLTLVRGGDPEYDRTLTLNQSRFIRAERPFLKNIARHVLPFFSQIKRNIEEIEEHHTDPHPKKALRIQAFQDVLDRGGVQEPLWMHRGKTVTYKLKTREIAKPGKVARMIGDLGVPASLQGAWIVKPIKKGMDQEIIVDDCTYEFCAKPDPVRLASIFYKLLNPPTRVYFAYFSDDSCVSIRTSTGVKIYNMDINKCDNSHRAPLFLSLLTLVPPHFRSDMQTLLDQCRMPIKIRNPDNHKQICVLKPADYTLYSGSTLTTVINNLANIFIARAIATSKASSQDGIKAAAETVGYMVSLEPCLQEEDIQFLKHSPVRDTDGNLRAMLNLGVLLRASGKCKGELPAGPSIQARAEAFQRALVTGMYPRTHFSLRTALLTNVGPTNEKSIERVATMLKYKIVVNGPEYKVDDLALYKRYRFTTADRDAIRQFSESGFLGCHTSNASDIIFQRDYGLSAYPSINHLT